MAVETQPEAQPRPLHASQSTGALKSLIPRRDIVGDGEIVTKNAWGSPSTDIDKLTIPAKKKTLAPLEFPGSAIPNLSQLDLSQLTPRSLSARSALDSHSGGQKLPATSRGSFTPTPSSATQAAQLDNSATIDTHHAPTYDDNEFLENDRLSKLPMMLEKLSKEDLIKEYMALQKALDTTETELTSVAKQLWEKESEVEQLKANESTLADVIRQGDEVCAQIENELKQTKEQLGDADILEKTKETVQKIQKDHELLSMETQALQMRAELAEGNNTAFTGQVGALAKQLEDQVELTRKAEEQGQELQKLLKNKDIALTVSIEKVKSSQHEVDRKNEQILEGERLLKQVKEEHEQEIKKMEEALAESKEQTKAKKIELQEARKQAEELMATHTEDEDKLARMEITMASLKKSAEKHKNAMMQAKELHKHCPKPEVLAYMKQRQEQLEAEQKDHKLQVEQLREERKWEHSRFEKLTEQLELKVATFPTLSFHSPETQNVANTGTNIDRLWNFKQT